jgi:hypothetical protein
MARNFPQAGWIKGAIINGTSIPVTSGGINIVHNPSLNHFAGPGPKVKQLHAKGTKEVTWNVAGEISGGVGSIGSLTGPFSVVLSQDTLTQSLSQAYMESWTMSAEGKGPINFSASGRALDLPLPTGGGGGTGFTEITPGWNSGGAAGIKSWSLSRTLQLIPHWGNDQQSLPLYYRFGEEELSLEIVSYNLIVDGFLNVGGMTVGFQGAILQQGRNLGDRMGLNTYTAKVVNIGV